MAGKYSCEIGMSFQNKQGGKRMYLHERLRVVSSPLLKSSTFWETPLAREWRGGSNTNLN